MTEVKNHKVEGKEDVILCPNYRKILNALMPPTSMSIEKHKYAYPASVHINSENRIVEAKFSLEKYTENPTKYIYNLGQNYKKLYEKGEVQACGIVYTGVIKLSRTKQQDAIILKLDSGDSYPIIFIQKFKIRSGSRGKVVFDEIECEIGEPLLPKQDLK
ncbi:MAG: hypothetical protein MK214_14890 [Thalassotalea sp.]|nr:hypothetical protein [Thalassotalea sp.]